MHDPIKRAAEHSPHQVQDGPASASRHDNAFGFLRLLFASLVIVSHAPQFIDGNAMREPLFRLTGSVGFGGLAVNGFFVISGYMVVASYHNQPGIAAYLSRRIARIYPAFIAACLVCLAVVAPLAQASPDSIWPQWPTHLLTTVFLHEPVVAGTFPGTPSASLNGAMWTIVHEFRCYLVVIALGLIGAFRVRLAVPVIAAALFATYLAAPEFLHVPDRSPMSQFLIGDPVQAVRLTAHFLAGATFYLYRDRIRYRATWATVAVGLLVLTFFLLPHLVEPAFALLGSYAIFTTGFTVRSGPLIRINNAYDISYGVYLYGWPIGKLLAFYWPMAPLPLVVLLTFGLACGCGAVSWILVERPVMAFMNRPWRQLRSAKV